MTSLTLPKTTDAAVAALRELDDDRAQHLADTLNARRSANTRDAYSRLFDRWRNWAERHGVRAMPAEGAAVAIYLDGRIAEGAALNTIKLDRAAIRDAHVGAGLPDPTAEQIVRDQLEGAARKKACPPKQAKGLTRKRLKKIRKNAKQRGQRGRFDVALISVMRDAGLRRSEAAALRWADVERDPDGRGLITIRKSKTDQHGEGAEKPLTRKTMRALERIRGDADDAELVFGLAAVTISRRIAAAAAAAGLGGGYSGHSPRVGMAQDLIAEGATLLEVQTWGRWRSAEMPAWYGRKQIARAGAVIKYFDEAA